MPSRYTIRLTGARELADEAVWTLDTEYFALIADTLISDGEVQVRVGVTRHEGSADLTISLSGRVTVPCDRCLAPMDIDIDAKESLKVVYGDHLEDDGERITIDERDGRIDLAGILFELVALQVPIQHCHPEGECDEQMANALQTMLVTSDE